MKCGLSALIGDSNLDAFFLESWPHAPFQVHGLSLTQFRELAPLASLDTLLSSWHKHVQAHLPDVADEASAIDVSVVDAKKVFKNGMGLLFNNVEESVADLKPWIKAIQSDLGLPQMTYGRCIAYATPNGKGTAPHFDQNINFVLQLHGTKAWNLAPNFNVIHPTTRHTLGLPIDPELAAYSDPLPVAVGEVMESLVTTQVILKPGSLLFVPRGYWHSTSAQGEALALNFTYNQPTWADLLIAALKSRLTLSPEWRELADGVSALDPIRRAQAESRFNELLLSLVDDLPNWQAADILGATEG